MGVAMSKLYSQSVATVHWTQALISEGIDRVNESTQGSSREILRQLLRAAVEVRVSC